MRKPILLKARLGLIIITASMLSLTGTHRVIALDCEFAVFVYEQSRCPSQSESDAACNIINENYDKCSDEPGMQKDTSVESLYSQDKSDDVTQADDALEEDRSSGAIREIQFLLARLGHDPGPIDGLMGKATCRAITSFPSTSEQSFECEYTSGLRDALIEAAQKLKLTDDERRICDQVKTVSSENIINTWDELVKARIEIYKGYEADLNAELAKLKGNSSDLVFEHVLSSTVLTTKGAAKFSLGKAIVLTTLLKQYQTSATLLAALATLEKSESIAKIIRDDLEAALHGEEVDSLDTLEKIFKDIADLRKGLNGVDAGISDMATVFENQSKMKEAKSTFRSQIERTQSELRKTRKKIAGSQAYRDTLLALEKVRNHCARSELPLDPT